MNVFYLRDLYQFFHGYKLSYNSLYVYVCVSSSTGYCIGVYLSPFPSRSLILILALVGIPKSAAKLYIYIYIKNSFCCYLQNDNTRGIATFSCLYRLLSFMCILLCYATKLSESSRAYQQIYSSINLRPINTRSCFTKGDGQIEKTISFQLSMHDNKK